VSNPAKKLTEKELSEVEMLAGLGLRYEDIAAIKGMCLDTLKKYAEEALQRGKAKAKAQVMQTAYKMALSGKTPAMTIFWLKTRAGWRENQLDQIIIPPVKPEQTASKNVIACLSQVLEKLAQGDIDPKTASSIAGVAGALLKAVAQEEVETRLAQVECVLRIQDMKTPELDF